jgi:hypothetical protein
MAGRHGSGAGNTHIGAMPGGSRGITMAIKGPKTMRGKPWPKHPAPVR